jgi:hypothetical protein
VALLPRGQGDDANTRSFRVPLVLIGEENRISIEVPSRVQEQSSRREFALRCSAPQTQQRLHLLVVGVDIDNGEALKQRVLDALAVDRGHRPTGSQGEFTKDPPFERCVLYHVLSGDVERSKVEAQLIEINKEIARLREQSHWLNDLVLIYYQGEDVTDSKRRRWLLTSRNFQYRSAPPEEYAIPCDELPRVPGTELLLLNVIGPSDTVPEDTGLLRYACNDPAEMRKPDSQLLGMMQEAVRTKGTLGGVVKYVDDLVARQKGKFSTPIVVVDKELESRRLHVPAGQ